MNSVKRSDEDQGEAFVYIGRTIFVNFDVSAEVGDTPTALLCICGDGIAQNNYRQQEAH